MVDRFKPTINFFIFLNKQRRRTFFTINHKLVTYKNNELTARKENGKMKLKKKYPYLYNW